MGEMDLKHSEYFESNIRFADAYNGILFGGEQVIKPEELEESDSVFVQLFEKEKGKKIVADKVKTWRGQHLAIIPLETQTYIDYRMVLRVMQEEISAYEKQRKKFLDNMRLKGEKLENDEFVCEMKKEWKFTPVVPLVIYLGKNKWDAASTLYELIDIEDILKPFINNYRLNLYDYHNETDFSKFKTENKYLFKLLYYSDDKEKIKQILNDVYNDDNLSIYVDKILLNTIGVSFNLESIIEIKNGKERVKLIKAIEDMINEGNAEGMDIGYMKALKENVDSLMKSLNITLEQALDTLNIDNEMRKNFYS